MATKSVAGWSQQYGGEHLRHELQVATTYQHVNALLPYATVM
jgi:hypothetical protein